MYTDYRYHGIGNDDDNQHPVAEDSGWAVSREQSASGEVSAGARLRLAV